MRRALDYYTGNPPPSLEVGPGDPDDNVDVSLARLVVDKGVSFLFGEEVHAQVTDPQPGARQVWLEECWRRNRRAITLQKAATNGGIFGHVFIRLLPPSYLTAPYPRVVVLDSSIVDVATNPDDLDEVWSYIITPPTEPLDESGKNKNGDIVVPRRTKIATPSGVAGYAVNQHAWYTQDQEFAGGEWVTIVETKWPYDFAPIVDCQNLPKANDFWGESDLPDDLLRLVSAINRVVSRYNKIIRLHAHPKIFTKGMGNRNIDLSIDSIITLPGEAADMKALEMQSDLTSTLAFLEKLLELLAMQARIPLVALGQPDNLGATPSGVALQIRYQPLLEKNESKRQTYGDMLVELDRRLLTMGNMGALVETTLHWPDVLPQDQLMERQVWVLDESLGLVSKATLAEKAGYDFEAEQKLIAEESAEAAQQMAAQAAVMGQIPGAAPSQPGGQPVPPPAALGAPNPDIAKGGKSR